MTNFDDYKRAQLEDPEFKAEYDKLEPEYRLAEEFIAARIKIKMSQYDLARETGLTQSVIARLESGNGNPTIRTISRVAHVLGLRSLPL